MLISDKRQKYFRKKMITLHNNILDKCLWQSGLFTWWRDCECWQGLVWYSGMDADVP